MFFTRIISDGYQFESDTFQNGSDIIQQPTVISSSACVRGKSTVYVCVCVWDWDVCVWGWSGGGGGDSGGWGRKAPQNTHNSSQRPCDDATTTP